MDQIIGFISGNTENYLNELKEYLSIPSISTLNAHKRDIVRCSEFVAENLKKIGVKRVEIFNTAGHPIVYGEWLGAPGKPTILIYGHYDVQPVDPIKLWKTDPFNAEIKDGRIWARGANDNKGQNFTHLKSVESFFSVKGELPVNVKFLIEGEEEIGSPNLSKFLKQNHSMLKCDVVLISDTSLYAPDIPTINYGLRGLCYMEVELIGPNRDLHSGSFGGAVANPINELGKLIAKLVDDNGKVKIPNFYKKVRKLGRKEKENFRKLKFSEKELAKELGVRVLQGEKGFSTIERLSVRPTLDCNGIIGGFTDDGAKTVLPARASAKISMRLVPDQDPKEIEKEFIKYVKSIVPRSVTCNVTSIHGGKPFVMSLEDKYIVAASKAVSKAFGKKTVYTREGGSIPIVVEFVEQLKSPVVLMGLGLDTDNIHSPNEHFEISNFERGILGSAYFINEVSNM